VEMATSKVVGVRRNALANGVTKNTSGDAKIPTIQTEIQPIVYLKLKSRFLESRAT